MSIKLFLPFLLLTLLNPITSADAKDVGSNHLASVVNEDLFLQDPCTLPAEPGMCYAAFPRYYYDGKSDQCKDFIYGGCGGNANRFETMAECGKFRFKCLRKRGDWQRPTGRG